MSYLHLFTCLLSGMFLTNAVPHFVHGVSGNRFPTPFAKPPGKGLSSPTTNMAWALVNLAAGYVLLRAGGFTSGGDAARVAFFAGIAVIGLLSSRLFAAKHNP